MAVLLVSSFKNNGSFTDRDAASQMTYTMVGNLFVDRHRLNHLSGVAVKQNSKETSPLHN